MVLGLTARHSAILHRSARMIALHSIGGVGAQILVVMVSGEAHAIRAATGVVGRPGNLRQRRIEHQERDQTGDCAQRTPAALSGARHLLAGFHDTANEQEQLCGDHAEMSIRGVATARGASPSPTFPRNEQPNDRQMDFVFAKARRGDIGME